MVAICHLLSAISDSEVILRVYKEWGDESVHHLVGVFAFARWDARAQRLFVALSPIAATAPVYCSTPQIFAFATMPRGLFGLPFFPRALNEEELAAVLAQSPAAPTATLYRGIYRLPTGHSLTVGRDEVNVRCYWQPDLRREIRFPRDED